jgi:hypothetical protein
VLPLPGVAPTQAVASHLVSAHCQVGHERHFDLAAGSETPAKASVQDVVTSSVAQDSVSFHLRDPSVGRPTLRARYSAVRAAASRTCPPRP